MTGDQPKVLLREPWPRVAGRPGLTQGKYGSAGNLELVAPDVDDGLWVGWFNNDGVDAQDGAAKGCWSGALKFGVGHRFVSVDITQVDAGPDFLEAVALTDDGGLRRHVWSPSAGFVDRGELTRQVASHSAVVQSEQDMSLHVAVSTKDGHVCLLRAPQGVGYPDVAFDITSLAVGGVSSVDAGWHRDHLDLITVGRDFTVRLWCSGAEVRGADLPPATAAQLTVVAGDRWLTTLNDRGTLAALRLDDDVSVTLAESGTGRSFVTAPVRLAGVHGLGVLERRGSALWCNVIDSYAQAPRPRGARRVAANVWVVPGTGTVHRS